jgi:hypothetical protein
MVASMPEASEAQGCRDSPQLVVAVIASASRVDDRFNRRVSRGIFRRVSRGIFAVALAAIVLLISGCGDNGVISRFMLKSDRIIVERRPDPVYDQLFPYYVELCATSQFRSKLKGEGGVAGHAVMYIKGACKDEQAPFPQLRRCRVAATRLDDPAGSGTSIGWRSQGTSSSIRAILNLVSV